MLNIAIIGGGAAGLMAADAAAAAEGVRVTLLERNPVCGKKICITGKGRCNVTNAAGVREMQEQIPRGGKFLLTALYAFPSDAVQEWFESRGVPLKTERGGRIFPASDRAADVAEALTRSALSHPNLTLLRRRATGVERLSHGFRVRYEGGEEIFDRVLLATGGLSYPRCGSTGDGYRLARLLGHRIVPPAPALCPLVAEGSLCREAMGLSLKNCALRVVNARGKQVYEDFGEMLFCHFGLSGPMILSASSFLDFEKEGPYRVFVDLKPALSEEQLDRRMLAELENAKNRDLVHIMEALLPRKLILPFLAEVAVDPRKKGNLLTREERRRLVQTLKALPISVTGHRPVEEAIVTRGGVALEEVDPRRMESKLVPGLYFAGEILDVDALTGGYNLQIAFSTGRLAGQNISREEV